MLYNNVRLNYSFTAVVELSNLVTKRFKFMPIYKRFM